MGFGRSSLKQPHRRVVASVFGITCLVLGMWSVVHYLGPSPAVAASTRGQFICAETGKSFGLTITPGMTLPVRSPYSGKNTGFTGKVKANDFSTGYWALPPGYSPKLTRLGNSSEKIFCADGAKYTTCYDNNVPSVSYLDVDNNHQMNNFSDYGAFFGKNNRTA